MKTLLAAVLATLLSAITLAAADPISGTWQVHQNIVGNESDMACTFTQTGDDLAGTCEGDNGTMKLIGKVSEKKVTWTIKFDYNGTPLTLKYSGALTSGTKITGSVSVDPYQVEGEFAASPAK
jgi:Tfp pilus tip-associated adhesin PilY1